MADADDTPAQLRVASLHDAGRFVTRYGPAVRRDVQAILRDPHAADDNRHRRDGTWCPATEPRPSTITRPASG